jgi:polysaccharide export outer membrane protein
MLETGLRAALKSVISISSEESSADAASRACGNASALKFLQILGIGLLNLLTSCVGTGAMRGGPYPNTASGDPPVAPTVASQEPVARTAEVDNAALNQLWERRTARQGDDQDYPVGPGDVLRISVPQMEEINDRKVRVSATGTIELPLVGVVQAGGMTEDGLAQDLDRRLQKYMYNPQASVFVDEYRNREVAVVGAVNKPGLVLLDSPSETILDVLTQVGGVAASAADELVLIPGDDARNSRAHSLSTISTGADAAETALHAAGSAHAVSISLHSTSLTGSGKYMNLPVRPGDVLVVPGGGEVMIVGWVHNPGHFSVGSGLTILGAIGEAGGPMYAADTKEVTLLRTDKNGSKRTIPVNLEKISHGEESDIAVKANDVVDVPYSNWRIGPYIFYSVVARIGIAGPAIPY